MKPTVLFLFNHSEYALLPWLRNGDFNVVTVDYSDTCLWTGNGFILPQKSGLPALQHDNPGHVKLGGKSARTKYIRSLTPRGFANALYLSNFYGVD